MPKGKSLVRKKGEDWLNKIKALHAARVTEPVIAGKHFAVAYNFDITTEDFGRITIDEIMLYEVKDGQIILEQFFY